MAPVRHRAYRRAAMSGRDPYRDERESLVAENERLRAALARGRAAALSTGARVALGGALLALNALAFVYLPALFNARDDGRVYAGGAVALLLVAVDVLFATRVAFARRPESP